MKRRFLLPSASMAAALVFSSCGGEPEKKPVAPTSENSRLSWTGQVTNPIQGQLGMLPQNQHRR
jgi:protein-disulfide isomerase